MDRKITAYGNYYKDFFDSLDNSTQEKVLYEWLSEEDTENAGE